ncbi:hypothetical protein KCP76_17815 [Salmonella enterica subsp. enterica serovar Weltevreden]|nr:hypothetical protein KCP76_17815 [Salmonella enterica subsp. enterica serovar Weltevreden]
MVWPVYPYFRRWNRRKKIVIRPLPGLPPVIRDLVVADIAILRTILREKIKPNLFSQRNHRSEHLQMLSSVKTRWACKRMPAPAVNILPVILAEPGCLSVRRVRAFAAYRFLSIVVIPASIVWKG